MRILEWLIEIVLVAALLVFAYSNIDRSDEQKKEADKFAYQEGFSAAANSCKVMK